MSHDRIARRFGRAAASYDEHSGLQRHAAQHLAELILRTDLPPAPRILEIGCGTGHLTELLAEQLQRRHASADFLATDIAPAMVAACRQRLPGLRYAVMDGERPTVAGNFDLICTSLTAQWFRDLRGTLVRLAAMLAPGGVLAVTTVGEHTFGEWREAHLALGLQAGTPAFPSAQTLRCLFPAAGQLELEEEQRAEHQHAPLDFLRTLRAIGADTPAPGHRPLSAGELRRVLRQLGSEPVVTYHLLHAMWRKPLAE